MVSTRTGGRRNRHLANHEPSVARYQPDNAASKSPTRQPTPLRKAPGVPISANRERFAGGGGDSAGSVDAGGLKEQE